MESWATAWREGDRGRGGGGGRRCAAKTKALQGAWLGDGRRRSSDCGARGAMHAGAEGEDVVLVGADTQASVSPAISTTAGVRDIRGATLPSSSSTTMSFPEGGGALTRATESTAGTSGASRCAAGNGGEKPPTL